VPPNHGRRRSVRVAPNAGEGAQRANRIVSSDFHPVGPSVTGSVIFRRRAAHLRHPDQVYELSAAVYDLLHRARGKDYAAEAVQVSREIRARNADATSLLDVACGTGGHLLHLRNDFSISGVELDPAMLDVARRRLPDVELHAGDMRTFDLGRRYDAVTCLFSAVGYMLRREDLDLAMATMARHLAPGGVLVVEPWFHPDQWFDGHLVADAANEVDVAVARVSRSTRDGNTSRFEFHYAVARPERVDTFIEPHVMGLWTIEEYRAAMQSTGLAVDHDPVGLIGRGLFIGVAPSD
jgi:SAM-dependent methyltransferase